MADEPEIEKADGPSKGLNRRKFLVGTGAVAGLVVAWAFWPRRYEPNVAATENEQVFGAFLKIS
ncbi:MAG: twin-arginine translocation signal domain-containing protein, partial [Parasphingorhabdus sp.]